MGRAVINIHVATHPGELADEAEADRSATLLERERERPRGSRPEEALDLRGQCYERNWFCEASFSICCCLGKRSVVLDSEFWRSFCLRSCAIVPEIYSA